MKTTHPHTTNSRLNDSHRQILARLASAAKRSAKIAFLLFSIVYATREFIQLLHEIRKCSRLKRPN